MAARILEITTAQYHRDETGDTRPSLSASCATTLVTRSPLHAWTEHPRYGAKGRVETPAQSKGTLAHRLVLGAGADIVVVDHDSWRSNAAKDAKLLAEADGKIAALADDVAEATTAASEILKRLADRGIVLAGRSELVIAFEETAPAGSVLCRSMLDHLDGRDIFDFKTIRSADLHSCEAHAAKYGYTTQAAAYSRAVEMLQPEFVGRTRVTFLFAEIEPPYAVSVRHPDGAFRECGDREWKQAVETFATCQRDAHWPGYDDGWLSVPTWRLKEMEARA